MSQFFNCMTLECMHCFLLSFPPIYPVNNQIFLNRGEGRGSNAWLGGGGRKLIACYLIMWLYYYRIEAIVDF